MSVTAVGKGKSIIDALSKVKKIVEYGTAFIDCLDYSINRFKSINPPEPEKEPAPTTEDNV